MLVFALSLILPLAVTGYFLGAEIVSQVAKLITALPDLAGKVWSTLVEQMPAVRDLLAKYGLDKAVGNFLKNFPSQNAVRVMQNLGNMGSWLIDFGSVLALWSVLPIYWAIFLLRPPLSGRQIAAELPFLSNAQIEPLGEHIQSFIDLMVSYFHGQFLDAFIQGILYATSFKILGLSYGIPVGFILGLLNVVPYLGNAIGLSLAIPLALFIGENSGPNLLIAILTAFVIIQTIDAYFILPYIQGNRMQLEAWVIIFALLFWTSVGGFLGLLLAVPLSAFIKLIWGNVMRYSRKLANVRNHPTSKEMI